MKTIQFPSFQRRLASTGLAHALVAAAGLVLWDYSAAAGTMLISDKSPVRIFVPTSDIGIGWRGPSFDDSTWTAGANGVGFEVGPGGYSGNLIADSVAEWSSAGRQGENSWIYGYYNHSADPDGIYQASDFQPFLRTDGAWGPTNFWDGGSWNWNPDSVPWDNIAQSFIHPNGTNSTSGDFPVGQEHWSIRRWRSTVTGPVTIRFFLRKDNTSGNGVTGKVIQNGTELFSRAIAGTDMTGMTVYINANVTAGDYLDFVQTPVGLDSDGNDGSDGSVMTVRVFAGTILEPVATTDSVSGWVDGVQGANGWYYGVYNKTADADGVYDPATDFNTTDPNWTFGSGAWTLGPGDPPWDNIAQSTWHPNGINNGHIDWVIRRWVSTMDGDLTVHVLFAKDNTGGGNGTTLHVLHKGTEVFSKTVAGTDGVGIDSWVVIPGVLTGDPIEFALDPLGTDGAYDDGSDGSKLKASIYPGGVPFLPGIRDLIATDIQSEMKDVSSSVYLRFPFEVTNPADIQSLQLKIKWNDGYVAYLNGVVIDKRNTPTVISGTTIADSIADWSTSGVQGQNGWYYGYYDKTSDDDGVYQPGNFTSFPHDGNGASPTDFWNGSGYDWFNGNPPWTELYQQDFHPNTPHTDGTNPDQSREMWVIRRWVATVDGSLKCRIKFSKNNLACGDGIVGYIFQNGTMVYSNGVAYNDSVGRDDVVDLPDVLMGDPIDIVMSPGSNDGCDGSKFSAVIFDGQPAIPWDAAATAPRSASGETIAPTVLDLTSFLPQLSAGTNVLAIQGLNLAASDNDFLISVELTANRTPVATNDSVTAWRDLAADYPTGALLANDSDPDGEALMLVAVRPNALSAPGSTVKLYGDHVSYKPAPGFVGADSFTYTVTDLSGIPITAEVQVTVSDRQIVGGGFQQDGSAKLVVAAAPGTVWHLERTLKFPAAWTTVAGPTSAGADGRVELVDPAPPAGGAFYRAVTP